MSKTDTETIPDLKVHRVATIYPPVIGEEREALKESIRIQGVKKPILVWQDENAESWIIDGRTRYELARELVADGVEETDSGELLLDTLRFEEVSGTEAEILKIADVSNSDRRQMSASQRVAVKALAGRMAAEYAGEVEGDDAYLRTIEAAIDSAGVSYGYKVYTKRLIRAASWDLVEKVVSDEINLTEGIRILDRRLAGKPDRPADEETPETTSPAGEKDAEVELPKTVHDGLKRTVPDGLKIVFVERSRYELALRLLRQTRDLVAELSSSAGGAFLPESDISSKLKELAVALRDATPHVPCPKCAGKGKKSGRECKVCLGTGYLNRVRYGALTATTRAEDTASVVAELAAAESGE